MKNKTLKALRIINTNPFINAHDFAVLYYTETRHAHLFEDSKTSGVRDNERSKASRYASAFLGMLSKAGLVAAVPYSNPRRYSLTRKGDEEFEKEIEKQMQKSIQNKQTNQ